MKPENETETAVDPAAICSPLPIATAPKDRAILLIEGEHIYKGEWMDGYWQPYAGPTQCQEGELNPTHWFPIPWETWDDEGQTHISLSIEPNA